MINSEIKNNELGNTGLDACISRKHPLMSTKKMVLADVQNDNRVSRNHRENSFPTDGGPIADKLKICGTKRPIPESVTSHPFRPLPDRTATKEHLVYTSKKFEFVEENGKADHNPNRNVSSPLLKPYRNMQQEIPQKQTPVLEGDAHHVPMAAPNYMAPKNMLSYSNSHLDSFPSSLANPGNWMGPAENDCFKVTSKVPLLTHSRRVDDRKWEERYIHLQNFLKMCDDESVCRDHVQSELLYSIPITSLLDMCQALVIIQLERHSLIFIIFYYDRNRASSSYPC